MNEDKTTVPIYYKARLGDGQKRGDKLGLTDYEVAFYDVLETNDGAMKI